MDFEKYNVLVENKNFSVCDFLDEKKEHKYVLQPSFQRQYVWDVNKASCLIESIILGLPIPPISLYHHHVDGKFYVIDGQQRLTAIRKFLKNSYKLSGLKDIPSLNGFYFNQLNEQLQNRILDYTLDSKCIKNVIDKKIIYKIFERYNTGIMTLKPQEIRNCVFEGKFNDLIKNNLAKYAPYDELIPKNKSLRMAKEEFAARFLAMFENNRYSLNDINNYITAYYDSKQHLDSLTAEEFRKQTRELEKTFKKAVDACKIVFKNNAYKNYKKEKKGDKYGFSSFSSKVFDIQMLCFAELDLAEVSRNADKIYLEYINFVKKSPFLNPELSGKQDLKTALRKLQDKVGKIIYDNYIS